MPEPKNFSGILKSPRWPAFLAFSLLFVIGLSTFQNFFPNAAPGFSFWTPFSATGDKVYLNLQNLDGGSLGLTWDGRLGFVAGFFNSPNSMPMTQTPILTLSSAEQPIATPNNDYIVKDSQGNSYYRLRVYVADVSGICNFQIYQTTTSPETLIFDLYQSGQAEPCTSPKLYVGQDKLTGGSGLYFTGITNGSTETEMFSVFPNTKGPYFLQFFTQAPFVGVSDASNNLYWTNTVGYSVKLFNPELMTNLVNQSGENPVSIKTIQAAMNASVKTSYQWGVPSSETVIGSYYPGTQVFPQLRGLGLAALAPDHSLNPDGSPKYPINPYYSDANGNPCLSSNNQQICPNKAQYLTYKIIAITPIYGEPENVNNAVMTVFHATAIVSQPYSTNTQLYKISMDDTPTPITYVSPNLNPTANQIISGIEPTITFDGSLILFQIEAPLAGYTFYTFNPNPANPQGWSPPRSIVDLNADQQTNPALAAKAYPLARYPIRDSYGNLFTSLPSTLCYQSTTDHCLQAAYNWMSLDGSDFFFSAATSTPSTARRAGVSVIGAGTKGMIRLLDGPPNISRAGESTKNFGNRFYRTGQTSPGRTPGQWSPLEFMSTKVLPLSDKMYTYPMFDIEANSYWEASFEEAEVGNYDLYLDMRENLKYNATHAQIDSGQCVAIGYYVNGPPCYDTTSVQDISGHFHYANIKSGAYFPPELPNGFNATTCSSSDCLINNPYFSQQQNNGQLPLFSGQALYFGNNGFVDVPYQSNSGAKILQDANALTVSLAVLPFSAPTQSINLASISNTFSFNLNSDMSVTASVSTVVPPNNQVTHCSLSFAAAIPVNSWSHLAFTLAPPPPGASGPGGVLSLYVNGVNVAQNTSCQLPVGSVPQVTGSDVYLGPNPPGTSPQGAPMTYALDQVGISKVVRSGPELARQAGLVFPRLPENGVSPQVATGMNFKDLKSPDLVSRALDPNLVAIGESLFFDPILSASGTVSCSICHQANSGFGLTEFVDSAANDPLHPNLLAGQSGQFPHLIRNTPDLTFMAFRDSVFRDGRNPNLMAQVNTVLTNPQEMNPANQLNQVIANVAADQNPNYQNLFNQTQSYNFPINETSVEAALQEFELSLVLQAGTQGAGGTPADQYRSGNPYALTLSQAEGMSLFYGKANCAQCHSGSAMTDNNFHNISFINPYNGDAMTGFPYGQLDYGRFRFTQGQDDYLKFMTPSLRNLNLTGPYEHNGTRRSVANVISSGYNTMTPQKVLRPPNSSALPQGVTISGEEMLLPINLTDAEQNELIDFVSNALMAPSPILYSNPNLGAKNK